MKVFFLSSLLCFRRKQEGILSIKDFVSLRPNFASQNFFYIRTVIRNSRSRISIIKKGGDNPAVIEHEMLDFFMSNVSKETLSKLYDKELPIPFANIKFTGNKNHGLKNVICNCLPES